MSNLFSPTYAKAFAHGANKGGGLGKLIGNEWQNQLGEKYRKKAYENYDKNRIYTPKDVIRETHYYEGFMDFQHSFTLTFRYKLRSFNDVNQKMAFLDLLANILNVTYRRATFWGGSIKWIGTPQDQRPFNFANSLIDKTFDKIGGIWDKLFTKGSPMHISNLTNFNLSDLFNWDNIKSMASSTLEAGKEMVNQAMGSSGQGNSGGSSGSGGFMEFIHQAGSNLGDIARGAAKNRLGRPQVYAYNSLLSDAATGPWHVTIGNPFNPIVAMGNLIIDSVSVEQSGALNIDDFPEELTVKIKLSHAKPRDITAISKMYTRGYGELYTSPAITNSGKKNSNSHTMSAQ